MHHLTDCAYPRIPAEKAVPALLARAGLAGHADLGGLIECMRELQGVRIWQEKGNT
jgi:hypothetical protein